jgi:hypothetical protein
MSENTDFQRPRPVHSRHLSETDVLTYELSDTRRTEMLEQCVAMQNRPESLKTYGTIGYFLARLCDHFSKYPEHVILEPVLPELYHNPQLYEKMRLKTALCSYGQTGAQLKKEVQGLIPKLKTPCVVGGLSTDFTNSCLIFIVLYIKRPYSSA